MGDLIVIQLLPLQYGFKGFIARIIQFKSRETFMKLLNNIFLVAVAIISLSACSVIESYNEVDALNEAEFVGSPFTRELAQGYKDFANNELDEMFDFPDALHFARKGLAAARGEVVPPEPLEDWNLKPEYLDELAQGRSRLVAALDNGGRDKKPVMAAKAQVAFDCWIEQQEENWQEDDIMACKTSFEDNISQLEAALSTPITAVAPVIAMEVDAPMAPKDAMYLVFFNWNSSLLDNGSAAVLDAVTKEIANTTPAKISIIGHADTSGSRAYNQRIGMRRAIAVRDGLIADGVDASLLDTQSRGQDDLLVETANNVREPANRRVNISFE